MIHEGEVKITVKQIGAARKSALAPGVPVGVFSEQKREAFAHGKSNGAPPFIRQFGVAMSWCHHRVSDVPARTKFSPDRNTSPTLR